MSKKIQQLIEKNKLQLRTQEEIATRFAPGQRNQSELWGFPN